MRTPTNRAAMGVLVRYCSWIGSHEQVAWIAAPLPVEGDTLALPQYRPEAMQLLARALFNDQLAPLKRGRFYPVQILSVARQQYRPVFRVRHIEAARFQADFNHPVSLQNAALHNAGPSPGPAAAHAGMENVLKWAGMEAPLPNLLTDFTDADRFERLDETDDGRFYSQPRYVNHLDGTCLQRVAALYDRIVPSNGIVLDLMSSWRSHTPARIGAVVGLGMNAKEMCDNPALAEYLVHDLNRCATLPFATGSIGAVINTASIEYLVRPQSVLQEVRRVLRPGGVAIFTFSNRYFPTKAIKLWTRLHPVERLGWVAQCLHEAGFVQLHTYVEHGLARAADDHYAKQLTTMDPLLAAWGYTPSPRIGAGSRGSMVQ